MLHNKGFDLWDDGYDRSVGLSDEGNTYNTYGGGAMVRLQAVNDEMHNRLYGKLNYQNCNNLVLKSKRL